MEIINAVGRRKAAVARVFLKKGLRFAPVDNAVPNLRLDSAELRPGKPGEELLHAVGQRRDRK